MGKRDPRVDAYIAKSQPFAQPILTHLRASVHAACPQTEETIKWGMPYFQYHGMLCGMAAFKAHATFGFWKGRHVFGGDKAKHDEAMGQFGRLETVKDLPAKRLISLYVKRAMLINEQPELAPRAKRKRVTKPVNVPADLATALAKSAKARKGFAGLTPGKQREYIEWLEEAKREETRAKRLATTIEWVSEGKSRNWKYENC